MLVRFLRGDVISINFLGGLSRLLILHRAALLQTLCTEGIFLRKFCIYFCTVIDASIDLNIPNLTIFAGFCLQQ